MRFKLLISLMLFPILAFSHNGKMSQGNDTTTFLNRNPLKGKVIRMKGSFIVPIQKRDSILIADQLDYGFTLKNIKNGTYFSLPDMSKTFDTVMLVKNWTLDTLKVYKKSKQKYYDISASVRITSFKPGVYSLPALSVVMPNSKTSDTLVFEPQKIKVCTMAIDTAKFKPHDIKSQIQYPITFREILPYIIWTLLLLILIGLIYFLIVLYRRKRSALLKPLEPAHIVALRELEKCRGNKYWEPDKQKFFYSKVTDIIREYISARYDIGAMEMTTEEIFRELKNVDITPSLYDETLALFELSDYVKFAKKTVGDEENAKVVPSAVRFITETYQSEIDNEAMSSTNEIKNI